MNKLWKKLSLFCTILCMICFVGAISACGKTQNDTVVYTVTVQLPNEDGVEGVKVSFDQFGPYTTDSEGKVSLELESGEYEITLASLPQGYVYDETVKVNASNPSATITLKTDSANPPTGDTNTVSYSVTVLYPNGDPVVGAGVGWCVVLEGGETGSCTSPYQTGTNGVATAELAPATYHVQIVLGIPEGYTYDRDEFNYYVGNGTTAVNVTADAPDLTITLKSAQKAYNVFVVDETNAPVSNVTVTLSGSSSDVSLPVKTDDDGKAVCAVSQYGVYTVNLSGLTSAQTYNAGAYVTNEQGSDVTVTVLALTTLNTETAMTDAEKTAYGTGFSSFETLVADAGEAYLTTASLKAGKTYYFAVVPSVSGTYVLCIKGIAGTLSGATYQSNRFVDDNKDTSMNPSAANFSQTLICTAGETLYFTLSSSSDEELSFAVLTPAPSKSVTVESVGTYEVRIDAQDEYAEIIFTPAQRGKYAIYSNTSEYDPKIGYYAYRYNSATWDQLSDTDKNDNVSSTDLNFRYELKIYDSELFYSDITTGEPDYTSRTNQEWCFRIYLNDAAATYPVVLRITIERVGDAVPKATVRNNVAVTETLSQFPDSDKTLIGVELNSSTVLVYNTTDRFYHVGSADGPVLVVLLTETCTQYFDHPLISLDAEGGNPYSFDVTSEADKTDDDKPTVYNDYRLFLRGFLSYDEQPAGEYYAKYVNSDGVYGVTEELRTFLTLYAASSSLWIKQYASGTVEDAYLWLFACYYYGDAEPEPEPSVPTGSGTYDDPYVLQTGKNSVTINDGYYGDYVSFTAPSDGEYAIVCDDSNYYAGNVDISKYADYSVLLRAGEFVVFNVLTGDMQSDTFLIEITRIGDYPAEGETEQTAYTAVVGAEGNTKTITAGQTLYFDVISGYYTVTFTGSVTVSAKLFNNKTFTYEYKELTNGEAVNLTGFSGNYVSVTSAQGESFTLTFTYVPGTQENPITATEGSANDSFTLATGLYYGYYTFTPTQSGWYKFDAGASGSVTVSSEADGTIASSSEYGVATLAYLTANTKYLLAVTNETSSGAVTVAISKTQLTADSPYVYSVSTYENPVTLPFGSSSTLYVKADLSFIISYYLSSDSLLNATFSGCSVAFSIDGTNWTPITSGMNSSLNGITTDIVLLFRLTKETADAATFAAWHTYVEGSVSNPYTFESGVQVSVNLQAGQTVYYTGNGEFILTYTDSFIVVKDGSGNTITSGSSITLYRGDTFSVTNSSDTAQTVLFTATAKPGTQANPIALSLTGTTTVSDLAVYGGVYYSLTADATGTYVLNFTSGTAPTDVSAFYHPYYGTGLMIVNGSVSLGEITAGTTLLVLFENYDTSSITFTVTVSFTASSSTTVIEDGNATKATPADIYAGKTYSITIKAGETRYFSYNTDADAHVTCTDDATAISYQINTTTGNGTASGFSFAVDYLENYQFTFTNNGTTDVTIVFTVTAD